MADVKCPMCSTVSAAEAEICPTCGARLKPLTAPLDPIHPGEQPTKIDTSELEQTLPTWLREVRQAAEDSPAAPSPDQAPISNQTSIPDQPPADFLAGLSAMQDDNDEPLPDWMAGLRDSLPAEDAPTPGSNPAQDLLASLMPAPAQPEPEPQPENQEPVWDFHDSDSAQTPDWLTALQSQENNPPPDAPTPKEEPLPQGDFPAWLSQLSAQSPAAAPPLEPEAPVQSTFSSGESSDWLDSLRDDAAAAQPPAETQPAADLPDWMASLGAESPAAPAAQPPAETQPAADLPDWMASLGAESPAAPAAQPPAESQPAADLPDWMASLGAESPAAPSGPESQTPQAFETGSLDTILPPENAAETPSWLTGISAAMSSALAEETPGERPQQPTAEETSAAESLPDAAPSTEAEPASDAVFSMDMPDWLAGFTPSDLNMPPESAARPASPAAPNPEDISPASLPSWVQALRPVEAVIAAAEEDDFEQTVEKEGPLAGFRAVLPVAAGLLKIQRPKTYSNKLDVDNAQQEQVALLENLLAAETRAREIPPRQKNSAERPLRWAIAAILLLVTLIPLALGSRWTPIPSLAGADLNAFASTLASVENGAPALIVVDYQPAFAGEMEPLAQSALRELMKKQARLAFVSTSPTGSLMAERLMAQLDAQNNYPTSVQLGYLPGGAAGIQVFASDPTRVGRGSSWKSATLSGITHLEDFAVALVLTDAPDEGRLWVEQAAPELRGKPLLMVISAQAEPMLRPYFDSHQIQGLMVGLNHGAIFEQQFLSDGPVRQAWDSFNLGLLVMETLIVVGGLWALIAAWLEKRAAEQEGAY